MQVARGILSEAKAHVYIVTTEVGLINFHKNFGKEFDELAEKGVEIRIKVPIGSSNTGFVNELRYVYTVENMQVTFPILLLIVDGNKLLITNLRTGDQKSGLDNEIGLFSENGRFSSYIFSLMGFDKQ